MGGTGARMALSRERERLIGRLKERRTRERERLFLVEGVRSAGEALSAGASVRFAVVSPRLTELADGTAVREHLAQGAVDTVEVADAELAAVADTEAPQGILLVCSEPAALPDELVTGPMLVIDGVQDPGNVGTLIRAAAAFGVGEVVVLDGTVDPYNPKAVRAAAGGVFRTRIRGARWDSVEAALRDRGPLLLADMGGEDVASVSAPSSWSLVVGAEGAGPRLAVRRAASQRVSIPMPGRAESLNAGVAGSILLYVLTRRRSA